MINITDADAYINVNVIDIEDWTDADADTKTRILNVASRTLTNKYPELIIPDIAVYEFAPLLAAVFNDTYKGQRYGVRGFSVRGISFTFAGNASELEGLIPKSVTDIISGENGVDLTKRRRKGWSMR